jgi:hypothetical protein
LFNAFLVEQQPRMWREIGQNQRRRRGVLLRAQGSRPGTYGGQGDPKEPQWGGTGGGHFNRDRYLNRRRNRTD